MNYYFTGIIILMLTVLAFCATPAYPRNEYLNNNDRCGEFEARIEKEDRDIVEVIMEQNSTLLNCILDMQDFMKEKGYGTKDFKKWIDQKSPNGIIPTLRNIFRDKVDGTWIAWREIKDIDNEEDEINRINKIINMGSVSKRILLFLPKYLI